MRLREFKDNSDNSESQYPPHPRPMVDGSSDPASARSHHWGGNVSYGDVERLNIKNGWLIRWGEHKYPILGRQRYIQVRSDIEMWIK